ncbi:hypothetical protein HPP92_009085 [Vanilla planifolia]|uniref:Uncharacterized protein n=1 Tax=Vanilla planifolia TaxID=51239 RepID=A0A835RF69_VANPL|nr:hypothetical protein HPP92_009085 [Vanilla planifolia]
MAQPAAAVAEAQPARQRQQQQAGFGLTGVIRMAVLWYFAMKFFSPKKPTDPSQLMSNLFHKGEPLALKHNGSLYAHVFFARSGYPPDPYDPEYQPGSAFWRTHPVVVYYPKPKSGKRRSLLNSKGSEEEMASAEVKDDVQAETKDDGTLEWISYWKPNITINLVDDFNRYPYNAIPQNVAGHLIVDPVTRNYFPTIYFNEFWLLKDKLIALNDSVTELPLNLEVGPIGLNKWQFSYRLSNHFRFTGLWKHG